MKLKALSTKELKILEGRRKHDIAQAEKVIVAKKSQVRMLRNEVSQIRARQCQLQYRKRLRDDFNNLHL